MERVYLLHTGKVISENSLVAGENRYDIYTGILEEFVLTSNSQKYKHFYLNDLKGNKTRGTLTGGYYVEKEALKYMVSSGAYTEDKLKTFLLPLNSIYKPNESTPKLTVSLVDTDGTYDLHQNAPTIPNTDLKFKWNKYELDYDKNKNYLVDGYFVAPQGAIPTSTVVAYDPTALEFYQNNVRAIFSLAFTEGDDKRKAALRYIISITLRIEYIIDKVFVPLYTGVSYDVTITSIKNSWADINFVTDPTYETFYDLNNRFLNFKNYLYNNSEVIIDSSGTDRLKYLYSISNALPILPIDDILDYFQIELMKDSGFEEILLNILKSISVQQSTEFLTKILERRPEENDIGVTVWKTMFQVIYQKLFAVFFGKQIWKDIMNAFYSVWLDSEYNPYDALGNVRTNFPSDPFLYTDSPETLEYKSEKIALIFSNTNYDFSFDWRLIEVTEQPYTIDPYKRTIGKYDIFQAVTIQNTAENTNKIKFPLVSVNGKSSAAVPMFYIMFIDDSKYVDNISTGVEVAFDIALTLTGVGNLAKLRHLRHLNKLGRAALGIEAAIPGQSLIAYELAQGVAGTIEIGGSVASMWINHVTNYQSTYCDTQSSQYDQAQCDWYSNFDNWMMFLQLKSAAVDFASSVALRNGARKLLTNPPTSFEPAALDIVAKFANENFTDMKILFQLKLTGELGTSTSNILNKLNNLPLNPINRQEEFIKCFQGASKKTLQKLDENTGELVDYWDEIQFLNLAKRNEDFLVAYKTIKTNSDLLHHVHQGDFRATVISGQSTKIDLTGMHNLSEMVIPPPYVSGKWNFKNLIEVKVNERGYKHGKIERNMGDYTDPAINATWVNVGETVPARQHMKAKINKSTFWPEFDPDPIKNTQRINEEMAHAFANKVQMTSTDPSVLKFTGTATDGQKIIIFRDKNSKWSIYPDSNHGTFN